MTLTYGVATDVGRVRDGNEDSYLVEPPLFAVADGMGGHLAGDVASSLAVDTIIELARASWPPAPAGLEPMIGDANAAIFQRARDDSRLRGMGTTCTVLLVSNGKAFVAHVGDSRAYLFRNGNLEQITEDHTLVSRMVKEGRLKPEDAERHPQRSIITRALGVDESVKVDVRSLELKPGDRLLLCSDGLTSMVSVRDIAHVLESEGDPTGAAERLVAIANEAGGDDNITTVIIDVGEGEETVGEAPAARAETPIAAPVDERAAQPARARSAQRERPADTEGKPPRKWVRRLAVWIGVFFVLGLVAYGAARWALANSWFVGVNEEGVITIYQGIPDDIAGLELKQVEQKTTVELAELPPSLRENVEDGIKVDSREEAVETVIDLEERAHEFSDEQSSRRRAGKSSQF